MGGRTGRVHTLVAAAGVEAHLAGPTLDALLLTLVDICEGAVGEEKGKGEDGAEAKGRGQARGRGSGGGEMPVEARGRQPLSPRPQPV